MAFKLQSVQENVERVNNAPGVIVLDGPRYGEESGYPLKVEMVTGGRKWSHAITDSNRKYSRGLSKDDRKSLAEDGANVLTSDLRMLAKATRHAVTECNIVRRVGWVGPVFDDALAFELWKGGEGPAEAGGGTLEPIKDADSMFKVNADGRVMVPVDTFVPEWTASDEDVAELLKMADFISAVSVGRNTLEAEGADKDADDLENLPDGRTTPAPGLPSTETSKPASKR